METNDITKNNVSNRYKIQYPSALDEEGNVCLAFQEDKTQNKQYKCLGCNRPMILHKSEKTGKYAKRPYFAHKSNAVQDCSSEGVLHKTFKIKLFELLKEYLKNNKPFIFESDCPFFKEQHSDNLLQEIGGVKLEDVLGECRPDILLIDKGGNPFVAIEIVVTHFPEDKPIQYYKENNILLYQINLKSFDDLENIEEKAKHPDYFNFCTRPKCPTCNNYMKKREITIKETICSKCKKMQRISTVYDDNRGWFIPPSFYNSEDINFALNNSVAFTLKFTDGKWTNRWLDHTCPHCNPLVSDENHNEIFKPLITEPKTDYYCDNCDNDKKTNLKKCDKCNRTLTKSTINIYQSKCHICNNPIIFADGEINDYRFKDRILKPYQFTQEQIDYAIGEGANICQIERGLYTNKFNANVCPKCGNQNDGIYNINNRLIASKEFTFCNYCNPSMSLLPSNTLPTSNETTCNICGYSTITNTLFIVEACCLKCQNPMKMAFVQENDGRCSFDFNSAHKDLASSQYGITFTTYEDYPIECPNCKNPIHKRDVNKYVSCKDVAHIPVTFCPNKYNKRIEYTYTRISHDSKIVVIFENLFALHAWGEYMNRQRKGIDKFDIITLNKTRNYKFLIEGGKDEELLKQYNKICLWLNNNDDGQEASDAIFAAYPLETINMTKQYMPPEYVNVSDYLSNR